MGGGVSKDDPTLAAYERERKQHRQTALKLLAVCVALGDWQVPNDLPSAGVLRLVAEVEALREQLAQVQKQERLQSKPGSSL